MRNGTFMGFHEAKWRFFMTEFVAWFVMDRKGFLNGIKPAKMEI